MPFVIMDVFCILKEAVHDVQEEIDVLKQENERLKAMADDCGHLQTVAAEFEVKRRVTWAGGALSTGLHHRHRRRSTSWWRVRPAPKLPRRRLRRLQPRRPHQLLMPPHFNGDRKTDAEEWLQDLLDYMEIRKVPKTIATVLLRNRLTGVARKWLESVPPETNFDEMIERFRKRFGDNGGSRNELLNEF